MATHIQPYQESAIFKKGRKKGYEQWFVEVSCNMLSAIVYGPFPSKSEALQFWEGAEFELRKLLDFELRIRSGGYGLGMAQRV